MSTTPLLRIQHLSYRLRSRELFSDLNLALPVAGLTIITGPNGSGKSTLAELIMGLRRPSSGTISFNNKDITQESITARARLGLSLAFQTPVSFQGLTVRDLLGTATELKPERYLSLVGLPAEYLDRLFDSSLSGGEKKRIELASVLAREPKLLILDEPEAGIDLWSLDNLLALFRSLKSTTSLLIISHSRPLIALADQTFTLKDGALCNL